jgi:hypothetical protein
VSYPIASKVLSIERPGLETISGGTPLHRGFVSNLSIASATVRHASASGTEVAISNCSRAICTALAPNRSINSSATRSASSVSSVISMPTFYDWSTSP